MNLRNSKKKNLGKLNFLFSKAAFFSRNITFLLSVFIICFLSIAAFEIVLKYYDINVWRHDSLLYYSSYRLKLSEEGRWINYFVFPILKLIPAKLAAYINLFCVFLFSYKIVHNTIKDKLLSFLFAIFIFSTPILQFQNLWPLTSMPSFLVLITIIYFIGFLDYKKSLFISSILFFGTISSFYFLMPLLFLNLIEKYWKEETTIWSKILILFKKIVFPWALFFVVGFIFSQLMTILITGHIFRLAAWREPHHAKSILQLWLNLKYVNQRILLFFEFLVDYMNGGLLIAFLLLLISFRVKKAGKFIIFSLVFLAPFYSTILHGINISTRSLFVSLIAFFLGVMLFAYDWLKPKFLMVLLFSSLSFFSIRSSLDSLKWYTSIGDVYVSEIRKNKEILTPAYMLKEIDVYVEDSDIDKFTHMVSNRLDLKPHGIEPIIGYATTILPALKHLGFKKITYKSTDEKVFDSISRCDTYDKNAFIKILNHPEKKDALILFLNTELFLD